MSDPNNDAILRMLRENDARLSITEVKEVPGAIPGFTSFYATGSFTPTWVGLTTPGTFTYTANQCVVEWSRIGNRLFFSGRIVITAIGVAPVGNLTLDGFPYVGVADSNMTIAGGGDLITWQINVAAGYTDCSLQMSNGQTAMRVLRSGDNVAPANVQGGELIVGDCRFEGQYRVA